MLLQPKDTMHNYLVWDSKVIDPDAEPRVTDAYAKGYVFVRTGKGKMNQTRSVRIALARYIPTSENRRVKRKTEDLVMTVRKLPLLKCSETWAIQKMGKDYYQAKFGPGVFSGNKLNQLLSSENASNFNILFTFIIQDEIFGHAIAYANGSLLHYAYPFYRFDINVGNYGIKMMIMAVEWAQQTDKSYTYLGSATKPTDGYKLQFSGLQWYNRNKWCEDLEMLKSIIQKP